jgi:integrase/recombinase XerD
MGELKDKMLQKMKILGYSENTQKLYLDHMKKYVAFHNMSPDKLGKEDIYAYQVNLVEQAKLSYSTLKITVSALRFFYNQVLNRRWFINYIPYQKKDSAFLLF